MNSLVGGVAGDAFADGDEDADVGDHHDEEGGEGEAEEVELPRRQHGVVTRDVQEVALGRERIVGELRVGLRNKEGWMGSKCCFLFVYNCIDGLAQECTID